jgi:hypothetical protein
VQLTCPSVTIQNEDIEYLKVGIYFSGKYAVYFLDRDHHLYELHLADLDDVLAEVKAFFEDATDLHKFDKHMLSVGNLAHFENKYFEYRPATTSVILKIAFLMVVTLAQGWAGLFILFDSNGPSLFGLFFLLLTAVYVTGAWFYILAFRKSEGLYLELSAGRTTFKFGLEDSPANYDKTKIQSINIFGQAGSKSGDLRVYEIMFKDGSAIQIPGLMIDMFNFVSKFPGMTPTYVPGFNKGLSMLYNYKRPESSEV